MKSSNHRTSTTRQTNSILFKSGHTRPVPALLTTADSKEVKEQYYRERIDYLKNELEELNLQEHPVEIAFICGEIRATQQLLACLKLTGRRAFKA